MTKLLLPLLLSLGCISADVSTTVVKTTEFSFASPIPAGLSGVIVPPTMLSHSELVDISGTLQQVKKFGAPSITITQNHLHSNAGDFSFIQEISASIGSVALMDLKLSSDQQASTDIDIPVVVSSNDLVNALEQSTDVKFDVIVAGTPPSSGMIDVVSTIAMDVSVSVSKNVLDLNNDQ